MMKFTLKFLLIFNLFCSVLLCNELSNTSNKIISLNSQLSIIKEQKSTTKDGDIAILEDEKNELLNRLPALITSSNDFNQTHLRSYIKALSAELNKQTKQSNPNAKEVQIALANAQLDQIYYYALSQISKAFKDYSKTPDEALIDAITQIQISNYQELKTISTNATSQIEQELIATDLKRQTYSEILNYLKENSELFDSSFVLTSLNLQHIIDEINRIINLKSS